MLCHIFSSIFIILITLSSLLISFFFFFNDTATTEIYTLSLHDALPICPFSVFRFRFLNVGQSGRWVFHAAAACLGVFSRRWRDRKSTRLNSSHLGISYAVFCLKKKKIKLGLHDGLVYCLSILHNALFLE